MFGKSVVMFFKYLGRNAKFIPMGFAGLFIISNFFIDWYIHGFNIAIIGVSKSLLAAELVINQNVHLALQNSPEFGLFHLFEIAISLLIMWTIVKFIAKRMIKSQGANENYGAYLWGLAFLLIIEVASVKIIDGQFGFIPLWDGVIFLIINIQPVLVNSVPTWLINLFNSNAVEEPLKDYSSNTSLNLSEIERITGK